MALDLQSDAIYKAELFDNADNRGPTKDPDAFLSSAAEDVKAIDWRYENLDTRSENAATRASELSSLENPNPFEQQSAEYYGNADTRIDRQRTAREGMDESGWTIDDVEGYDSKAFGAKKFGKKDVNFLRSQGADDDLINQYLDRYGKQDKLNDSLAYNKDLGGEYYKGDMAEGTTASDFDFGNRMTRGERKYLQAQSQNGEREGFSNEDIFDATKQNMDDGIGISHNHHRWMDKQGLYDDFGKEQQPQPDPQTKPTPDPTPQPTAAPNPQPTPPPRPTPQPTPAPTQAPSPVSGGAPQAPSYGYQVAGNPYSSANPGYYYGTEQQARDTQRYNDLSDASVSAFQKGLSDIGVWQQGAAEKSQYYNNIVHEIYKQMGLVPPS